MKHIVDISFDTLKGTVTYDDVEKQVLVSLKNPELREDILAYLTTKRAYRIPVSNALDDDREETALPTDSLMHWELAMCTLLAETGVRVEWETERQKA